MGCYIAVNVEVLIKEEFGIVIHVIRKWYGNVAIILGMEKMLVVEQQLRI